MTILDNIPLPFGTSVGEVTNIFAAEVALSSLMADKKNNDGVGDKIIDHVIAVVMVIIAKARQSSKA
jgi:hypothetical protein